jgi:hypothetical protein
MNSILNILFALLVIFVCVFIFIKIALRIRRGGGSIPYFISSGTLDATLDQEHKAAATTIVEQNAHKKMEEQSSTKPTEK